MPNRRNCQEETRNSSWQEDLHREDQWPETRVADCKLTDVLLDSIASVSCFENEHSGVRILGKSRCERETSGTAAYNDKIIVVGYLAVVDDVPSLKVGVENVVTKRVVINVPMTSLES